MDAGRSYVDIDPQVTRLRTDESEVLQISLPGFKRDNLRVLVDNHRNLRATGEQAIEDGRWRRFQKDFQIPPDCSVDSIRAKFENETLTVTLPTSKSKPKPKPTQQPATAAPPAPPVLPAEAPKPAAPAPAPATPAPAPAPAAPAPAPSLPAPAAREAAIPKAKEDEEKVQPPEEEVTKKEEGVSKRRGRRNGRAMDMEEEVRGKVEEEDMKSGAVGEEMEMARRRKTLLVNVAVALVVLVGIAMYVWRYAMRSSAEGEEAGSVMSSMEEM